MSSDLKNKMDHWEAKPPESAWNRITASLDADDEYVLAQKFSSFESQPPRHVWEQIEAGFTEQNDAGTRVYDEQTGRYCDVRRVNC